MPKRPTRIPTKFDVGVLELGRQDAEAGHFPLNPRNRHEANYLNADTEWLDELSLHIQWVESEYHKLKPKP